ncbi:unnamed protein product [Ranitomeya imitator]|uniref:Ig-like domain-containing protein n=1 Tax=Ranitomeya imitator TaxID=111125 RepID=A0ABN9LJB5_9NEOB|nr:unnamed protein product [Ranitomeya imitator]
MTPRPENLHYISRSPEAQKPRSPGAQEPRSPEAQEPRSPEAMAAALLTLCTVGVIYLRNACLGVDVVQTPAYRIAHRGGDELLICQHLDNSFPAKLWYRQTNPGDPLLLIGYRYRQNPPEMEKAFTGINVKIQGDKDTKSILSISNVSSQDSATYYCASSAHSAARISLAADVMQNPTFITPSAREKVSVTCEHDDSSKYTKSWYRQEKNKGLVLIGYTNYVDKASMEPGFTDGRIQIQPESSQKSKLIINDVSAQDNAVYYCASIIVATDVLQHPKYISSSAMHNISMTCEHDDSSKTRKIWYRQENNKGLILIGYTDLTEEALMEPGFKDGRVKIQAESSKKSFLTIGKVSDKDNAVYYCASSDHSERIIWIECKKLSTPCY